MDNPDKAEQGELIRRAQAGDRGALEALLLSQQSACFGFALRLAKNPADAEDFCQDALVRAARDIKAWRPLGSGSFRSWLLRIVLCAFQNWRAAESARRQRERRYAMTQVTTGADSAKSAETTELKQRLEGALLALEDSYRLPIALHYEQGLSRSEVAAVLEIPEGTVATHIRRGVERLRVLLTQAGFDCPAPAVIAALGTGPAVAVPTGLSAAIHGIALSGAGHATGAASVTSGLAALSKYKLAAILAATVLTVGAAITQTSPRFHTAANAGPIAGDTKEEAKPEKPLPYHPSTVSGVVVDATTNKPLAGLTIVLKHDAGEKIEPLPGQPANFGCPTTVTDEQGRYTGRFMTSARTCLSQLMVYVDTDKHMSGYTFVGIYQGESVIAKPIALTAYQTVRGQVVDPDGKPVAGARVYSFGIGEATTDKDGYFTDNKVPPHKIGWDVEAQGFELNRFSYWVGDPKAGPPLIRLTRCKAVTGTVSEAEGNSLKDVVVYGGSHDGLNVLPNWHVPIEKDGRFTMGTVPEKAGPMYVFPVRGKTIVGDPVRVDPGQTGVALKLYAVGQLDVQVKGPDGKPLENVSVHTSQGQTEYCKVRYGTTDVSGRVTVTDVPAGQTKVEIYDISRAGAPRIKQPLPTTSVQIDAGKKGVAVLTCEAAGEESGPSLTGFLLDEKSRPILHASLEACLKKKNGANDELFRGFAMTEVDGRFEIRLEFDNGMRDRSRMRELEPPEKAGQIRIAAGIDGYSGQILNEVRDWPAAGQKLDLKNVTVKVAPERIFSLKGERPGNVRSRALVVSCNDANGKEVVFKHVDDDVMNQRIAVRSDGALTLKADDGLGHNTGVTVAPDAGSDTPLVAKFPAARQIEFMILDSNGKPVEGVAFHARPPAKSPWPFPTKWSDKEGKLSFELAAEAEAKFVLYKDLSRQPWYGEIKASDKPIVETIRLKDPDASISGKVTAPDGKAMQQTQARLEINLDSWLSTSYTVEVDAEGRFNMAVPSGLEVLIHASAATKDEALEAKSEKVKLTAGQKATLDAKLGPRQLQPWETKPDPKPVKPPTPSSSDF